MGVSGCAKTGQASFVITRSFSRQSFQIKGALYVFIVRYD